LEVWVPFQQRVGSATQGDFSPAWKFLGTIVAVVLRNVRLNQQGPPRCFSDPCGKMRKTTEDVSVSGDQFSVGRLNMTEGAKAVDLKLKNKLVGIEGFNAA